MALPSVVPAPASIEADGSAPFALTSGTPIVAAAEIADATEALQSLIETRTGLRLDTREPADSAADARAIVLEIAGDGAAESYRLDAPPLAPTCTSAATRPSAEDYDYFIGRVSRRAASLGKTPVAWHEAGTATDLEPTTVGQFWGYVEPIDGMDAKARGFTAVGSDQGKLILSPADAIYLDMKFDADSPLGLTWARGVTTARRAYEWDPAEVVDGVADEQILGVEAPLWTETARTLADIDALAFPRAAAAAEAAWSPAAGASELRTWESFAARVGALAPLWTSQGIGFTPLDGIPWAVEVAAGADRGDA